MQYNDWYSKLIMKILYGTAMVTMGCDPEFFFARGGAVIGAEKVLEENGLDIGDTHGNTQVGHGTSKVIIDGVQAELNPVPNTCRANLGNEISHCFKKLQKLIEGKEHLEISFQQVVSVSQEEMDSLSEKSKKFGCAPSNNVHNKEAKITVNPAVYKYRSAGGHIHLGSEDKATKDILKSHNRIVPMMDIIVGNTCVLLDREPLNAERRKVYGRAGEYRSPVHGLEYRTLSNFWLQSYQLMSLVFGLARMAVCIISESDDKDNFEKMILEAVSMKDITKAINENDFELAYSNFLKIEPIISEMIPTMSDSLPLSKTTMKAFKYFISKGVNYWFKENPLKHWAKLPEGHGTGWESFLSNTVTKDMNANKTLTLMEKVETLFNK